MAVRSVGAAHKVAYDRDSWLKQPLSRAAMGRRFREPAPRTWLERGRTVAIEVRWSEGSTERSLDLIAEFVRGNIDVIATTGSTNVIAAKQATSLIPIMFAGVGDPVGTGVVASLARPGGNATGLSLQQPDLAGKRLGLIREVLPNIARLAIMGNVTAPSVVIEMHEVLIRPQRSGPT